jgi:hypothetical protein
MPHRLIRLWSFVVIAVFFAAVQASASCPTAPTGPYYFGISTWYDYGPDDACWDDNINGALTPITVSCAGSPGWSHGYGYTSAEYEFDITTNQSNVLQNWYVDFRIHFDDPHNSSFNWVRLKAYVTHNGVTTPTTLFYHTGGTGDLSCASSITNFNAVAGDNVRLLLETNNWYNDTVIQTTFPHIENSWP